MTKDGIRVGIAADHGGFELKEDLAGRLSVAGYKVVDFGAFALNPDDDYPDFVIPLAETVAAGRVERGVAICGSGVGASVCANKIPGVRAALIHGPLLCAPGRRGRSHQHHLSGRQDCRPGRGLGSGTRRSCQPSSVRKNGTSAASRKSGPANSKETRNEYPASR